MTSNVWHCFCNLYLSQGRTQVLIAFQHYHVTQHLVGHKSVESKTNQKQKCKTKTKTKLTNTKTEACLRPVLS